MKYLVQAWLDKTTNEIFDAKWITRYPPTHPRDNNTAQEIRKPKDSITTTQTLKETRSNSPQRLNQHGNIQVATLAGSSKRMIELIRNSTPIFQTKRPDLIAKKGARLWVASVMDDTQTIHKSFRSHSITHPSWVRKWIDFLFENVLANERLRRRSRFREPSLDAKI